MKDEKFLESLQKETVETLEKRWYALKDRQMQGRLSTDEKNEIRRIERRIKRMRQW